MATECQRGLFVISNGTLAKVLCTRHQFKTQLRLRYTSDILGMGADQRHALGIARSGVLISRRAYRVAACYRNVTNSYIGFTISVRNSHCACMLKFQREYLGLVKKILLSSKPTAMLHLSQARRHTLILISFCCMNS